MSELNINQLLATIGDRSNARSSDQALRTLYSAYDDAVRGFITQKFTQDAGLIDEVVQDTFVEVWKFPERYNDEYAFKTWLLGIARHKAIDALRLTSATTEPIDKFADTLPARTADITEVIHLDQISHQLKSGLTNLVENGKLSTEHKDVLQLMYVDDLNVTEIAGIVRCPENTVKTRLHYARERVRNHFETYLTGFIFHDEAVKFVGSTKIDQAIEQNSVNSQTGNAAAIPQNNLSGAVDQKPMAWETNIGEAAGSNFQVGLSGNLLSNLTLPNHFQNFVCHATGANNAKLAVLHAQNSQPAGDLAYAVDGAVPSTDCEQALVFLVSAGGNPSLDGGGAKTASGVAAGTSSAALQTGSENGNAEGCGLNTGTAILNPNDHNIGGDSHDHDHKDTYNNNDIAHSSVVSGTDAIQIVGVAHEPTDILTGHHLLF